MPVEIRVPILGESVVEAVIGKWLKNVGDPIAPGEPVVELETEKVNLEVPAEEAGRLDHILKGPGSTVTVGEVIGTMNGGPGRSVESATTPTAATGNTVPGETLGPDASEGTNVSSASHSAAAGVSGGADVSSTHVAPGPAYTAPAPVPPAPTAAPSSTTPDGRVAATP